MHFIEKNTVTSSLDIYHRHSGLGVGYSDGLGALLWQGISRPVFCGGLVCGSKELLENLNLKTIKSCRKVQYNIDIIWQSACLVVNSITVYSYDFLFNFPTMGQASGLMIALT